MDTVYPAATVGERTWGLRIRESGSRRAQEPFPVQQIYCGIRKWIEQFVTLEDDPNLIAERNREHAQLIRNIEANGYKVLVREDNDGVDHSIL